MEKVEFLTQGFIEGDDHFIRLIKLLSESDLLRVIFNIAFIKTSGINLLLEKLRAKKEIITVFAGIRNGITSIQAIFNLLDIGVMVYLVDTGSGNIIYHPKLYIFEYSNNYKVLIGSANLTGGGLNSNIEFSSLITFNKNDPVIISLLSNLNSLPDRYEKNIIRVLNKKEVYLLFKNGLLIDERINTSRVGNSKNHLNKANDNIPRMKLKNRKKSVTSVILSRNTKKLIHLAADTINQWILVWESKELKERDLNIPSGTGTNPTGSMLFKKGNFEEIDQRIYFRNEVFFDLNWIRDNKSRTSHYERAYTNFQLEIRGVNYGIFNLKLSHNTDTKSESYHQKNSMTQIHWGDEAKKLIAHRELLGEKMLLFRSTGNPPVFLIKVG